MRPGKYDLGYGHGSITVTNVKYHRNGIGGDGFYVVRFSSVMDDGVERGLIGMVRTGPRTDNGRFDAYVVNPADIRDTLRGHDYFGDALFRATKNRQDEAFGWQAENADVTT